MLGAGAGGERAGRGAGAVEANLKLAPGSELKAKLGSLSAVVPLGPELIVVSGGVVSIACAELVWLVAPAALVAVTRQR